MQLLYAPAYQPAFTKMPSLYKQPITMPEQDLPENTETDHAPKPSTVTSKSSAAKKPKNQKSEIKYEILDQELKLRRYPFRKEEALRAWDAADEYALNQIAEEHPKSLKGDVLVINDGFGALCLPLLQKAESVCLITDSMSAQNAIKENALDNLLDLVPLEVINGEDFANKPVSDTPFSLVIIKVPKSLSQLEYNLQQIGPWLSPKTVVVGTGMVKNVHSSTLELFEKYIGKTTTSLAKKKARLIFCQPSPEPLEVEDAPVTYFDIEIQDIEKTLSLASYLGVFSHGKLDWGTTFMLESISRYTDSIERSQNILDLGCGIGVLGIAAALKAPDAYVLLTDESHIAVRSTKESIARTLTEEQAKNCQTIDAATLDDVAEGSQDLVLNNPPFHDASARTPIIALNMFRDARRVLRKGGELVVVANQHLGYHKRLKEFFGNCEVLATNKKFVVLRAVR